LRPAAFLDRDGVVNVDFGYVRHVRDWHWIHGARAGIEWLKTQGYWVIVVTNQSAIARGLATEPQVLALHDWVLAHARVDAIYHCRHLPGDPCPARKPQPGMLQGANPSPACCKWRARTLRLIGRTRFCWATETPTWKRPKTQTSPAC